MQKEKELGGNRKKASSGILNYRNLVVNSRNGNNLEKSQRLLSLSAKLLERPCRQGSGFKGRASLAMVLGPQQLPTGTTY